MLGTLSFVTTFLVCTSVAFNLSKEFEVFEGDSGSDNEFLE
jgi:hypothetical protein